MQAEDFGDKSFVVLFVLFVLAALLLFQDFGYSWDETIADRPYGQAVLRFYTSGFHDLTATNMANFYLYGGIFDGLAEQFTNLSPLIPRDSRHFFNICAGILCLLGTWRTARIAGGQAAGFWAALFLIATPPFVGHAFINAKDIPFAAGYVWSLYWLLRLSRNINESRLADRLWLGVALGMTLGVRIGGLLIVAYILLVGMADLMRMALRSPQRGEIIRQATLLLRIAFTIFIPAYIVMAASWPAAIFHPISVPLEALGTFSHFKLDGGIFFNGTVTETDNLPWNYLPVMFGVELPEFLVFIIPCAFVYLIYRFTRPSPPDSLNLKALAILAIAALFPPLWAIATRACMYDNMRHFLFVIPPLCCLAASAFVAISKTISPRLGVAGHLPSIVVIFATGFSFLQMARLHPYEYVYKNAFAGGMPTASSRYETDYWLTSYREAAKLIVEHAHRIAEASGVPFSEAKFSLAASEEVSVLQDDLPQQFEIVPYSEYASVDYVILSSRYRWNSVKEFPNYPLLGTVGRLGMSFAFVKMSPEIAKILQ